MLEKETREMGTPTGAFTKKGERLELRVLMDLDVQHPKYKSFINLLHQVQKKDKGLIIYSSGL